jgi:isoquinoline 1-oxidoreductase subunit alpha
MATLKVNGSKVEVAGPPDMPLLWALRDGLGLTGTKFGCGIATCGACTVHVDGKATRACVTPISAVEGKEVTTIESIGETRLGQAVQAAWIRHEVPQCGYCQSGQVMAAAAMLAGNGAPTDEDIDRAMRRNLCRCGTYNQIRAAIKDAAAALKG